MDLTKGKKESEIVYSYTKAEAVADGQQVEISGTKEAKESGFTCPVYLTSGVNAIVDVPKGLEGIQDRAGRLWDLLQMARPEALRIKKEQDYFGKFTAIFMAMEKESKQKTEVFFIVFNEAEGWTIMLPEEY